MRPWRGLFWGHDTTAISTSEGICQYAKYDLICRKLGLKPVMRILDIGCGWGGFAIFASERYGVRVVGVTISSEQKLYADALVAAKRIGHLVEIRLQDYRNVTDGPYDNLVSVGMFEHVGRKNYRTYMQTARRLLVDGGLFLLHTIAANETWNAPDPWYDRYIFPNSYLPSVAQIGIAIDRLFVMKDWHTFGQYYVKTLLAWYDKFEAAWPRLESKYGHLHGGRFFRMWKYYLLSMAGGFEANRVDLWQIILSPKGVPGGYVSVR
jgi:cyclopropane-fatty-acyl-phospholipid synthase